MNEIDEMCQGKTLKALRTIKQDLLDQGESAGGNKISIVNEHIQDAEMYAVRQIVSYVRQEIPLIELKSVANSTNSETIIAYVTKGGKGLGILRPTPKKNNYGFIYHSDMLLGNHHKFTYISDSNENSIALALKADRKVYVFSAFKEFLSFAADHDEY